MLSPKKVNCDSPTITPSTASMAMRPCLSSDSLYLAKFSLSGGAKPRGSKYPKGPGIQSTFKTFYYWKETIPDLIPETPGSSFGLKTGFAGAAGAAAGRITESITWITPLSVMMSVVTTDAPSTFTPSAPTEILTSAPLTVFTFFPFNVTTVSAKTLPGTTWYVRIEVSLGMSFRRASTVPGGSLANAASVGAKTVNGPALLRVGTNPAAVKAAARVLKEPAATACVFSI